MKVYKKIIIVLAYCSMLTVTNCFAATIESQKVEKIDNENYIYQKYSMSEDEEIEFLSNIENSILLDNNEYNIVSKSRGGGNITTTKDITTTKTITSKTNNELSIINQLGQTLEYNEDGFIGTYDLNINTLKIKSNYNGYYEKLIEETKEYNNLSRNDLDFINKEIQKDGITLNLLNTTWETETTKKVGDTEIPDTYKAICYYAGKIKVDYPLTYTVTGEYFGNAEKVEINPVRYTIVYKEKQAEIPQEKNNIVPIVAGVSGGTTIIALVILLFRKNIKIYNLQDGKWVLVGKAFINYKKPKLKLDKFKHLEVTSKYKIELSKDLVNKISGKFIEISKKNIKIKHIINEKDKIVTFSINL